MIARAVRGMDGRDLMPRSRLSGVRRAGIEPAMPRGNGFTVRLDHQIHSTQALGISGDGLGHRCLSRGKASQVRAEMHESPDRLAASHNCSGEGRALGANFSPAGQAIRHWGFVDSLASPAGSLRWPAHAMNVSGR